MILVFKENGFKCLDKISTLEIYWNVKYEHCWWPFVWISMSLGRYNSFITAGKQNYMLMLDLKSFWYSKLDQVNLFCQRIYKEEVHVQYFFLDYAESNFKLLLTNVLLSKVSKSSWNRNEVWVWDNVQSRLSSCARWRKKS